MIEINGRHFCENCFEETEEAVCKSCGFDSADSAPDPSMIAPGSVLLNRYVIGRVIGKGGFGITYLAYDALVGRKIAIKEYFPYGVACRTAGEVSVTSDDSAEAFKLGAEKFYNEARLVSKFNGNPNITGVYDCFYENNTVYIVMEYLHGQTLKEYIRGSGILNAPQALFVAKNICNALVVAHSASVLHRDISPDNIIICDNGDIKLIDFGAARQVVAEHSQSFSVIIKPGYAPPEQYRKKGKQGPWTDIYSLGTTLYFTLTGDIPEDPSARFDDDDTFKENLFDIVPELWEIITKATKLKIDERYADAYELNKAIDRISIKPEPLIIHDEQSDSDAAAPIGFTGNIANMSVSIKPMPQKQSFFRRHLRTFIEIACGLAMVAVMIPLAIKANKPADVIVSDPNPDISTTKQDETSQTEDNVMISAGGNTPDLRKEDYDMPLFSILSDSEKKLYSDIYYGLLKSEKEIPIVSATYTVAQVDEIYNCVLNDNPLFNHATSYNISYTDSNVNREADPDEYVNAVVPVYNGVDPHEANDFITQHVRETRLANDDDKIKTLRIIYDELLNETELVARGGRPASSGTHGAVIDHAADDLGLARAICDYAQRLVFYSFVADWDIGGNIVAIVRVKIDDAWYNIVPRVDYVMNSNIVTAIPVDEDANRTHVYFLTYDGMITGSKTSQAMLERYDEKYLPILPLDFDINELPGTHIINYYFNEHLKVIYFMHAVDLAYEMLIEEAKIAVESGEETIELYIYPLNVDELWAKMNESYISDLSEKYGITISGFTGEYSLDAMYVTLEK